MPSKVILSAAGSRKTTYLVDQVIDQALSSTQKSLVLTYTNENLDEIKKRVIHKNGVIPSNVKVQGWFTFLLKEGVRPYQNFVFETNRISGMHFDPVPESKKYVPKTDIKNYYLTSTGKIYRDRISDFVFQCNQKSKGAVIERLQKMYHAIYIDEIQDLAGWDLDFLDLLLNSSIELILVGDIRQATYATNNSQQNKAFKGELIINWFKKKEKEGKCKIEERSSCYRCNQAICDFADALYPKLPITNSENRTMTAEDGLFYIKDQYIEHYIKTYNPQVLRWDKDVQTVGNNPINYGLSKGQTYDRVLIYLTEPLKKYLKDGLLEKTKKNKKGVCKIVNAFDIPKFYVAVTRARHSVAFIYDKQPIFRNIIEYIPENLKIDNSNSML